MNKNTRRALSINNIGCTVFKVNLASITNLTTTFSIKRGLIKNHLNTITLSSTIYQQTIFNDGNNLSLRKLGIITQKISSSIFIKNIIKYCSIRCFSRAGPSCSRLSFLLVHFNLKSVSINHTTFLSQCVLRQIQRESISVIKLKSNFARK